MHTSFTVSRNLNLASVFRDCAKFITGKERVRKGGTFVFFVSAEGRVVQNFLKSM